VRLTLPINRTLHAGGRVVVKVLNGARQLDVRRTYVTLIPARVASQRWDDFMGIAWGTLGAYQKSWIGRWKADRMRKLGFHAVNCIPRWYPDDWVWPVRFGLRGLAMNTYRTGHDPKADARAREAYQKTGDKLKLVREPSLSDPKVIAETQKACRGYAEQLHPFRPIAYNFGDEVAYAPNGLDYDFSPHALAEMREWLKTQYASLKELNAEWEADFKTWDDVMPSTSREAVDSGRYARWADLRLFACYSVAKFHRNLIAEMKQADPKARYGLSGTQVPYPYNGMDWAQVGPVFSYLSNYWGGGELPQLHADITPDCRLAQWIGYGSTGSRARWSVWTRNLHNQAGISFYDMFSMLNPDLRPSQSALDIAAATRDLRHGLTKLLMNSDWTKDRVAMYYSMPSILGWTITGRGEHKNERYGWLWAIVDCGIQPKYITYLDVREHGISRSDFDVLVLPSAIALSTEESDAIREFVREGGTVLTDSVPAVLSGHCRKLDKPSLDDVFGVVHETGWASSRATGELRVDGQAYGLSIGEWSMGTQLPTDTVRLSGGRALGAVGDVPAFIVNRFGKGKACYLNVFMGKYLGLRANGKEAEWRERIRRILDWAGAKQAVPTTGLKGEPIEKLEILRYASGRSLYVGYVLDQEEAASARTTFPAEGHVYDMRKGKYLGQGRAFDVTLPGRDALMLASLPYRVTGIEVKIAAARRDSEAEVRASLQASSQPGLHVFRVEVVGPDGQAIDALAQNMIARDGQAQVKIPFALNDPAGEYTVKVRDVATGVTGQAIFGLSRMLLR